MTKDTRQMDEVPDPGWWLCWRVKCHKGCQGVCWQNQNPNGTLAGEVAAENAVCLPVAAGCHGGPGSAVCLPELPPGARTALPSTGLHPTPPSSDPLLVSPSFPAKPQPGRSSSPGLPEPPKGASCSLLPSRSATGW